MIFQELNKIKQSTIMYSIVLLAIGVLMSLCPDEYTGSLIMILGNGLLITGCVMIMDFLAGKREVKDYILLTAAMFMGILGLCTNFYHGEILKVLGWLFGVLLIFDGFHSLCHALLYARRSGRRGWWFLVILSVLLMFIGVIIFANRWWDTPHKLMKVIGGSIMFAAVVGMLRAIWIWPLRNE